MTTGFRRALVHHYMSAESMLPWPHSNDFKEEDHHIQDHRDIVMVAGDDPYAYKGIENIVHPFIRRDHEPHQV